MHHVEPNLGPRKPCQMQQLYKDRPSNASRKLVKIRIQRFGSYDDPNAIHRPEVFECFSWEKLEGGAFRFKMKGGTIYTIPGGDMDIAEMLSDGTSRSLIP
jgi:hypothetical protein